MVLNDRLASFSILRTNPKISGNVKVTVDSSGKLWLNSIDANKELSVSAFKKFPVAPTSNYEANLKAFIGGLQPKLFFDVRTNSDPLHTGDSFRKQYDFFYAMGASPLISKLYDEDYSYFAPIWLREQLPDYFVILRVDEPLDFPYNNGVDTDGILAGTKYKVAGAGFSVRYRGTVYSDGEEFEGNASASSYAVETGSGKVISLDENKDLPSVFGADAAASRAQFESIMKRAQIIKTFDLTGNSNIGKYLRNIVNHPQLPASPVTVRFDKELMTTWNGPSYRDGVIASKGEFLDPFWTSAQTQIDFEEYITQGFERHGIVSSNLLNLEFLFNDDTASLYSIPRYLGFYVSKTVMGTFQLDGQKLYDKRFASGNTPAPKRPTQGFRHQDRPFFQNNPDGVRLYYDAIHTSGTLPDSSLFDPSVFEPRLYWVQDRERNFYSLNATPESFVGGDYNLDETDLVVRNTSVDLGKFGGGDTVKLQGRGEYLDEPGRSYMVIRVADELFPGDRIRIYWNIGSQTDGDGKFDEITANDLSQRPFTVTAGGTVLTYAGDLVGSLTVASEFHVGDAIAMHFGNSNVATRTITSPPVFALGNTTFSINAPIDLSTTSGHTPIVPGWGPGSFLAAQSFDPIYFHPYGTSAEVARAIAGAFNTLEARTFDVVAVGDQAVVRMRHGSSDTNTFFCKATMTDYSLIALQGQAITGASDRASFEGGTDLATTRMRFQLDATDVLKTGESWVRTKLGLDRIVHVGRYVDAAVLEAGGSDISALDGFDEFGVFEIENELDTPIIGSTKEFVAYNLFDVPTGLFSFFGVKDIDGDFLSSTYGRSPTREYHRYFDLLPDEDVLVPGRKYLVLGDATTDSIRYNSAVVPSPIVLSPVPQVPNEFTAVPGETRFIIESGNPIVVPEIFYNKRVMPSDVLQSGHTYLVLGDSAIDQIKYPILSFPPLPPLPPIPAGSSFVFDGTNVNYAINAGNPIVVDLDNFVVDEDLKAFSGFQKLKDFVSIQEIQSDNTKVQFSNREKFFHGDISSEYDYLKENFTKEDAAKSRLVPTVSKWVYSGGSDVRDNPYRLNAHPAFGTHNFSPSFFAKQQSPESFSHEWYYLEGSPQQYPKQFIRDNYYFFPDKIDLDLLRDADPAGPDYFLEYFTFEPPVIPGLPDAPDQGRYSIFEFNRETGLSETLFRGVKIRLKEVIRDSRLSQLQGVKPPFKDGSARFDGYKFSCLLRVRKETSDLIESPVQIHFVENKTTKTVTLLVDVVLEDYRTLTLDDPENLGSFPSPLIEYPDTLDSTVDYLLLYSMKSKKTEAVFNDSASPIVRGLDANKIGDIKLSVGLNMASPSGLIGSNAVINVYDNPDYDWDMRDEVRNFRAENRFYGTFRYGSTRFPYPLASTQKQILFGIPGNNYPQDPFNPYNNFSAPPMPTVVGAGTSWEWEDPSFVTFQFEGGNLYYEPIMQRISFARIAEKINGYSPYVRYRSYTWDASTDTTVETEDEFYAEFIEPALITKNQSLIPQLDEDKPQEFKKEAVIGVDLLPVNSSELMLRYSGPYEPKFKDVLFFRGQKTDQIVSNLSPSIPFDLSFQQATFNPSVDGFGMIGNMHYLKISEIDILRLANNTKYPSLYPLINEIAIDRRDFPVFESSWDPGFWRTYTGNSSFLPQAGTREMLEVRNFFGAKIMKTQKDLVLQTFTVGQVDNVDDINIGDIAPEIAFSVAGNKIKGVINLEKRTLRFLEEDGADAEFTKNLMPEFGTGDPDTLNDDVNEYLRLNVLPEYEVKLANMYVRRYKEALNLSPVEGGLSDANKLTNGYRVEPNFVTQKKTDLIYTFEFTVDPGTNVSISPSFKMGKI